MRKLIFAAVLSSLFVLLSCAPAIYVSEDYDRRADFAAFKTFDWMSKPEKMPESARATIEQSPFLGQRIKDVTDRIMTSKGMTMVTQNPNLLINYYVSFRERYDINEWGYYYGPFWAYRWPYLGPMDIYTYQQGTLVLDFVNAKNKELVWRGVADRAFYEYDTYPNVTESDLEKILTKMLAQYPPRPYPRPER